MPVNRTPSRIHYNNWSDDRCCGCGHPRSREPTEGPIPSHVSRYRTLHRRGTVQARSRPEALKERML
ncbi:hypothetical protein J6590_002073 [Homalodisca vitripennis]|nr:hypothetical protein J6590_002073 [Homalodisca vitripennis]